jgi:hypothetical protein
MPRVWRPTSRVARPAPPKSVAAPACLGSWARSRFHVPRSTSTSGSFWPRSTTDPTAARSDPGCRIFEARSSAGPCGRPGRSSSRSCRWRCWVALSSSPLRSSCSSSLRSHLRVLPSRRWRRRRSHWFRLPNRPNPRTSRHRDRARSFRRRPNPWPPRSRQRRRNPRFQPARAQHRHRSQPPRQAHRSSRRPARPRSQPHHPRLTQAHPPRRSRGARRLRRADHRHRRNCEARSARLAVPDFRKAIKAAVAGSGQGKEQSGRSEPRVRPRRIRQVPISRER